MQKILSYIRNKHSEIFKILLLILCTFIILIFLPKEGKFRFDFEKGKPWMHEDLIAPFDFAIQKPSDQIKKEKEELINNHIPFYDLNLQLGKDQIQVIRANVSASFDEVEMNTTITVYLGNLIPIIEKIYLTGIINLEPKHEKYNKNSRINILIDNISEEKTLSNLFTQKNAYKFIDSLITFNAVLNNNYTRSFLQELISPNIFYNRSKTENHLKFELGNISTTKGIVQENEMIVSKGNIVDEYKFNVLESLKTEFEIKTGGREKYLKIWLGQALILIALFGILTLFLISFRYDIYSDNTKMGLISILITFMVLVACWSLKTKLPSIYILPYCIVPIILRVLFDTRLAIFVHIITILMIGFFVPNSFEFAFIEITTGIIAVFSVINMRKRAQFFISAILIFFAYSFILFSISILQDSVFSEQFSMTLLWFGISSFLSLLAYPLIFAFEKIFGFISELTLLELSDTNNPLLKKLSLHAPGTFQHTLQVTNLAEAAIYDIGGNALLVRAGALYHDIGKMEMPMYFIENQTTGINPHNELPPEESAEIIIRHVINGIEKAQKNKLPEEIIDFIRTHHGTTRVEYFYHLLKQDMEIDQETEKKFQYPGPLPYSKETAVLMMADAVEAASRSLTRPTKDSLDDLVEKIIELQIKQDQFINSNITFKDIKKTKKIFKKMLQSIYHVRVEYPS